MFKRIFIFLSYSFFLNIYSQEFKSISNFSRIIEQGNFIDDTTKSYFIPHFGVSIGQENTFKKVLSENFIGFSYKKKISHRFSVISDVFLLASSVPTFTDTFIDRNKVIPGFSSFYVKRNQFYFFPNISFLAQYKALPIINMYAGFGKNFLGNGYRSLLLSDYSPNAFFIKFDTKINRSIQYENLFSRYINSNTYFNPLHTKIKYVASHSVKIDVLKKLHITLWESVVWGAKDTLNNRATDIHYLNPIIFYRPVEYSIGSSDNMLIGTDVSLDLFKGANVYAQLLLDEFYLSQIRAKNGWWANKYGVQFGAKYTFNLGKINGLMLAEHNRVSPYTYSHLRNIESYSHLGQPLAHPLGANFSENMVSLLLGNSKQIFKITALHIMQGLDSSNVNLGYNILASYNNRKEYGNFLLQGTLFELFRMDVEYYIRLSSKRNFMASFQLSYRSLQYHQQNINHVFFNIGLRTALLKSYNQHL